jgi:flagella basal body P-ring formation protein FlgA
VIAVAIALAFIAVGVYRNEHRASVANTGGPVTVLVARKPIQKGATGDGIRQGRLYKPVAIRRSDVRAGAIVSPAALAGKVALRNVPTGSQLTAADFGPARR